MLVNKSITRNKELFNFLKENKSEIEKEIGDEIEWIEAAIASRIKIKKAVSDVFGQLEPENYFKWLCEKIILFRKVFGKQLKKFRK